MSAIKPSEIHSPPKWLAKEGDMVCLSVDEAINKLAGNNKYGLGKWQIWLFGIISASFFFYGFSGKTYAFMNKVPKGRMCKNDLVDTTKSLWTFEQARNISTPLKEDGKWDPCQMYDFNYTELARETFEVAYERLFHNGTPTENVATLGCTDWFYDQDNPNDMKHTVVTQFGLMCDDAWGLGLQFNMATIGGVVNDLYGGPLVDMFGRKRVLLVSAQIWSILSILQGVVTNWYLFLAVRAIKTAAYAGSLYMLGTDIEYIYFCFILLGAAAILAISPTPQCCSQWDGAKFLPNSSYLLVSLVNAKRICFVLGSELMPDNFRKLYVSLIWISTSLGGAAMSIPAYFIRDWRPLMIYSHVPFIIFYIYYALYLPESPRWLVAMNREKSARKIIQNAADWNGVKLPKNFQLVINESPERIYDKMHPFKKYWKDLVDTLKHGRMLFISIVFIVTWNLYTVISWGIYLLSVALPGNMFVVTALYSMTHIGGSIISAFLLHWSRQKSIVLCMILSGLGFFSYLVVPEDMGWLQSAVPLLAYMVVDAAANCMSILLLEVYPVRVRTTMTKVIGISTLIASLGSPYISTAVQQNESLMGPVIAVYGGICLAIALIFALLVPDTQNEPMSDAVEEALELQTKQKKIFRFGKGKKPHDVSHEAKEETVAP